MYYIQKGLTGTPEVLIDPNKFSTDGTSVLSAFSLSKDGKYLRLRHQERWFRLVRISRDGSRHAQDVAGRVDVGEGVGQSWAGNGFYYSRYPAPEKGHELSTKNENHQVWFHKVGTDQAQDELVYEDKANPQRFHNVSTTEDERFALLNLSDRGKGKQRECDLLPRFVERRNKIHTDCRLTSGTIVLA